MLNSLYKHKFHISCRPTNTRQQSASNHSDMIICSFLPVMRKPGLYHRSSGIDSPFIRVKESYCFHEFSPEDNHKRHVHTLLNFLIARITVPRELY